MNSFSLLVEGPQNQFKNIHNARAVVVAVGIRGTKALAEQI